MAESGKNGGNRHFVLVAVNKDLGTRDKYRNTDDTDWTDEHGSMQMG
jgi:hypothetical protein